MTSAADSRSSDPFSGLQLLSDAAYDSLGSMETVDWVAARPRVPVFREFLPGVALSIALASLAVGMSYWLPSGIPLGASALALLAGVAVRNLLPWHAWTRTGCRWVVSRLIPVAVVTLGAGLHLGVLADEGIAFLGYIVVAVVLAVAVAPLLGRCLGTQARTAFLIGAGTGVCGSSAILALAPAVDAEEEEILLSVGAINLVGLPAMFLCIAAGAVLPFSAQEFGIVCGSTIHAVPTVAGAAFDHSAEAGETATLVKLGRVAMLAPLVVVAASFWRRRKRGENGARGRSRRRAGGGVPWFVWGFLLCALAGTAGLIPDLHFSEDGSIGKAMVIAGPDGIVTLGKGILLVAMSAIGLQVGIGSLIRSGARAVGLALAVWGILAMTIGIAVWWRA